jgi:hypothetical protein
VKILENLMALLSLLYHSKNHTVTFILYLRNSRQHHYIYEGSALD